MVTKFAYIVAGCSKYTVELTALLNSLDFVGNKQDLHLIGINLSEEFTSQFDKLGYRVIHHAINQEEIEDSRGISEVTCRKRYWYAAEIGNAKSYGYEAVCILDADLIFTRNPIQYFEIAAKTGYIVGPCKEQNKVYDDPHCEVDGEWKWKHVPRGFYNEKDMCNCPVFIDARKWETPLRWSWNIFHKHGFRAADMCAMNLSFLEFAGQENLLTLAGIQWLGTNEQNLKPYVRTVERNGQLFSEMGPPIYCYHGHYGHAKWRKNQLDNRHNCAQGYLKASGESLLSSDNIAAGSMNLLFERFRKMFYWKIQLPAFNYRHPEEDYKEEFAGLWG